MKYKPGKHFQDPLLLLNCVIGIVVLVCSLIYWIYEKRSSKKSRLIPQEKEIAELSDFSIGQGISIDDFVALTDVKMIPRSNEFEDLNKKDVNLHVLNNSDEYAKQFPELNR